MRSCRKPALLTLIALVVSLVVSWLRRCFRGYVRRRYRCRDVLVELQMDWAVSSISKSPFPGLLGLV